MKIELLFSKQFLSSFSFNRHLPDNSNPQQKELTVRYPFQKLLNRHHC